MRFFSEWLTLWCLDSDKYLIVLGCPACVVLDKMKHRVRHRALVTSHRASPAARGPCLEGLSSRWNSELPEFKGSFQRVLESSFLSEERGKASFWAKSRLDLIFSFFEINVRKRSFQNTSRDSKMSQRVVWLPFNFFTPYYSIFRY